MKRSDYRDAVKNKLAELATNLPDIFPDSEINAAFVDTIRGLPWKGVYKEEFWFRTLSTTSKEYGYQTGTIEIERVEVNEGTSDREDYVKVEGYELFANTIILPSYPSSARTMRVRAKMKFTEITDDDTDVDVPDEKAEAVKYGMVRRLLENLIHYVIDSKNYDSILKPDGLSLPQLKGWRDEIRAEEERTIKSFKTKQKPREMNLIQ